MKARFLVPAIGLTFLASLLALAGCRSAHTTSAILYIEEQQYDKAVNVLHEGLEYNPDEPEAYYWLGEAHSKIAEEAIRENDFLKAQSNYEKARDYYLKAKQLDPEGLGEKVDVALKYNFEQRSNDAKREYRAGYYEQAEGFFRLAYAANPDSISAIKNLARMKMQMAAENPQDNTEILEEALDLLDTALKENPDVYALQADKASVLRDLGRAAEADQIYTQLVREHGDDPGLLIDVANLAIDQEQYERAADLFVRVADIYANDTDPTNDDDVRELLVRSASYLAAEDVGRYDEALELFDRALQRETFPTQNTLFEYLRTYYDYGRKLDEEAGDDPAKQDLRDKAKSEFQRGVEVGNALVNNYPDYSLAYYYLGLLHGELGDQAAAEANLKKYSELENLGGTE